MSLKNKNIINNKVNIITLDESLEGKQNVNLRGKLYHDILRKLCHY